MTHALSGKFAAREELKLVAGNYDPRRLTGFFTCLNENYFIRAFIEHHRQLGVEQFVFFDDQSTDGTLEYLKSQPDCVIFGSRIGFGDHIVSPRTSDYPKPVRFGPLIRNLLAEKLGVDGWIFISDIDEFLILPPGVASVREWISEISGWGFNAMRASLVEFFPDTIWRKEDEQVHETLHDLLSLYPYFDADPLAIGHVATRHAFKDDTTTRRLNRTYHVREPFPGLFPLRRLKRWLSDPYAGSPPTKMPLYRHTPGMRMRGRYPAETSMPRDIFLTMMHLKFTADLDRRARLALERRSYDRNSVSYDSYSRCLANMREDPIGSFLGPKSVKYEGVEQFLACGLMRL